MPASVTPTIRRATSRAGGAQAACPTPSRPDSAPDPYDRSGSNPGSKADRPQAELTRSVRCHGSDAASRMYLSRL